MNGIFNRGPQRLVKAYWRYLGIALIVVSGFRMLPVIFVLLGPILALLIWVFIFSRMRL